ncbi:hypothetical protein [uncultured Paraglaciecola sp.]|uniref:hypothetical protein n=1 Tax=uncultured Paraglaciecola sp. TaxID=1765024 RepID=UPI0026160966|nr:hypothetical protein [uncultured Paraglaciecola sp.]
MSIETDPQNTPTRAQAPKSKTWVYLLVIVLALSGFGYFSLLNRSSASINHDYYRVLYEASNKFNENLNTLNSMHQSEESVTSIRALLPSYSRESSSNKKLLPESYKYQLIGQQIKISNQDFVAFIELPDLLPNTTDGFSQYLFADNSGKVVANTGGEKTISIVEMKSINKQILQKNKFSALSFNPQKMSDESLENATLPTFSSHVDMQLSYGDFRIFIFPFTLSTPLNITSSDKNTGALLERLYLVGLLPKHRLDNKGSGHWNISVLVVSLISLLFMWALIRLFLLPDNQSITKFYRILTQSASYGFYIVLVALILSYLTKSGLQSYKQQAATQYATELADNLKQDLKEVFNEVSSYRGFYSSTIAQLNKLKPITSGDQNSSTPKTYKWSYEKTVAALNNALRELAKDRSTCVNCTIDKPIPHIMASDQWHTKLGADYNATRWENVVNIKNRVDRLSQQIAKNDVLPAATILQDSYEKDPQQLGVISFYSGELQAEFDHEAEVFNTHIPRSAIKQQDENNASAYTAQKIFTIFATNEKGFANLPSIYFQESNSKPQAFSLLHREYFKRVRDYRGWLLDFSDKKTVSKYLTPEQWQTSVEDSKSMNDVVFRNVYIQRLLNINDGTRGTTISVPMHQPNLNMPIDMSVAGYVLGADVILPSVSLAPPSKFDFVFMVVDRNTGEVLFHSDEDRSLVENLFYAGHSESHLSQWIKAGLDVHPKLGGNQINGFYHGEAGHYTLTPTIVDNWAMVVFSPSDSLDSFMTNQFIYILVTFVLLLSLILLFAKIAQHWASTRWIRINLGLPQPLDTKRVMLICTAIFTTNYGLFYIGQLLQMSFPNSPLSWFFSPVIPLLGMAALLVMLYRFYLHHFVPNNHDMSAIRKFTKGAKLFSLCLWLVALTHFAYLQFSAAMPLKSLQFYYSQQECNGINKEYGELTQMALKRFPNSVTQQRIPPFLLLPMEDQWQQTMLAKNAAKQTKSGLCEGYLSSVEPQDYPKMSTLVGSTYLWKWMKTYLINATLDNNKLDHNLSKTNPEYDIILCSILILLGLVWVWFYFNRKVLWPRIYCPSGFLRHIQELCSSVSNMSHEQPSRLLMIQVDSHKLSGVGLALLLRNQEAQNRNKGENSTEELLPGFEHLFQLSPCLQMFSVNNTFLPNLKINLSIDNDSGLLIVKIWDIETCLEKIEFRQHLLDMIMEIKSLTMSGNLHSFTLYSGFMSLRRVKMKDPLAKTSNSVLEHTEYMSWSECLMDFSVKVTHEFVHNIDADFLYNELKDVPELRFLSKQLPKDAQLHSEHIPATRFWQRDSNSIKSTEWATIHYILLHADALYRFKWESCSSAEKLALYNLAKQHRLNPSNTEMIEHLAINGMIKVRHDHLAIINKSFAHFVLHAESTDTLRQLVREGEAGIWKSYRIPLGMLIVLIIGGVAVTSGQSIFIIAASLAGVLGTIGSLTNSASMLKGQFKE